MRSIVIISLMLVMVLTSISVVAALAAPSVLTATWHNPETYRTANGTSGMQPRVMLCDTLPLAWASGGIFLISSVLLGFAIRSGLNQKEMVRAAESMERIARELESMQDRVEQRVENLETILTDARKTAAS